MLSVDVDGPEFAESLAGRVDTVSFGLPEEYRSSVEAALMTRRRQLDVVVAAHGLVGSSVMAFRRVATFVGLLLDRGPDRCSEPEIWAGWDDAGRAVTT